MVLRGGGRPETLHLLIAMARANSQVRKLPSRSTAQHAHSAACTQRSIAQHSAACCELGAPPPKMLDLLIAIARADPQMRWLGGLLLFSQRELILMYI